MADYLNTLAAFGSRPSLGQMIDERRALNSQTNYRNLLGQQVQSEMAGENTLRELYGQYASGDEAALQKIASVDPSTHMAIQKNQQAQAASQRELQEQQAQKLGRMAIWANDEQKWSSTPWGQKGVPFDQREQVLGQYIGYGDTLKTVQDMNKSPYQNVQVDDAGRAFGFNTQTGRMERLPGDTLAKAPKSGMAVDVSPDGTVSFRQGPGVGVGGVNKTTMNKVEDKILNAGDTLSQLTSIKSRFKPEYQQFGTRLGNSWTALKDKMGSGDIPEQDRKQLEDFTSYRAEAVQLFALTLKDLSGVAVNPTEFKRAEAWLPNPGSGIFDGDSPLELKSKVDRFEEFTRKALMKYAYIQRHGLTVNDVDVEQMPSLMNKRGNEIAAELQKQGVSGDNLKYAVKQRLADEFGMVVY